MLDNRASQSRHRLFVNKQQRHTAKQCELRLSFGPPVKLKFNESNMSLGQTSEHKQQHQSNDSKYPISGTHKPKNHTTTTSGIMMNRRYNSKFIDSSVFCASIIVALLLAVLCHCDNNQAEPLFIKRTTTTPAAVGAGLNGRPKEQDKDKMLSSLADQVERQHLKLGGPLRSLVQLQHSSSSGGQLDSGGQRKQMSASNSDQIPDSYLKLYQAHEKHMSPTRPTRAGVHSGTHDMQQIMMMHELASQHATTSNKAPPNKQEETKKDSKMPFKWFTNKHESIGVGQKFITPQVTKTVMASLLSYLAPSVNVGLNASASKLSSSSLPPLLPFKFMRQHQIGSSLSNTTANSLAQQHTMATSANKSNKRSRASSASQLSAFDSSRTGSLANTMHKQLIGSALGLGQMMMLGSSDDQKPTILRGDLFLKNTTSKPINTPQELLDNRVGDSVVSNKHRNNNSIRNQIDLFKSSPQSNKFGDEQKSTNTKSPGIGSNVNVASWLGKGANQLAQSYIQNSLRDLLTLTQLPILSGGNNHVSTAPSDLEPGGKQWLALKAAAQQAKGNRTQTLDDIIRYAYIFGSGVRRKRDPLKMLASGGAGGGLSPSSLISLHPARSLFGKRQFNALPNGGSDTNQAVRPYSRALANLGALLMKNRSAKPRGVMWDIATDPTLAVTVFHLLERASAALPLGFLLMPFVQMVRTNPLHHFDHLARVIPARASHRSVDYEELAKRLDMMDKILSRALRPTHRETAFLG